MSEVFRVNKTKDYTVMSNHHFKNKNLSLKAKGLLSLMLSLPDNWNYSIKGLATLSKDGRDSVMAAIKELVTEGYIVRRRLRNAKGQVADTEYIISETPMSDLPTQEKPTQDNPTLEKPTQENPTLSNTNQSNTNIIKYPSINHSSNSQTENSNVENYVENFDDIISEVKEQIDYIRFIQEEKSTDRLDEIVNIIAEIYISHKGRKINGCTIPYTVIESVFRKLDYDCIQYVIYCIEEQSKKSRISNIKGYLITALYNAPFTISNYYSAQCNYDMENKDS